MPTTYQQDFLQWTEEQAQYLLNRQFDLLDVEYLADEVLSMGKSEQRALKSRMAVLLAHLIKWAWQPEKRGNSWVATIEHQRLEISELFDDMPSLRNRIGTDNVKFWISVWKDARIRAHDETGIDYDVFPEEIPWSCEDILQDGWYPEPVA